MEDSHVNTCYFAVCSSYLVYALRNTKTPKGEIFMK